MSQEKVTRYKEEKANRKAIIKKQKTKKIVGVVVTSLVCVLLVGWLGWSGVDYYDKNRQPKNVEVDYAAINDYLESLNAE